jgi:hypothetical protein
MMYDADPILYKVNYRNANNIGYLFAMLEATWGVERISTLMLAVREIRINQEKQDMQ